MTKITKHFSEQELTYSETAIRLGIENTPSYGALANLKELTEQVLEPMREHLGKPISITSGYRSVALNEAIGGANMSQHIKGYAADIVSDDLVQLFQWAVYNIFFDQLIWERKGDKTWIHVSYVNNVKNRNQVLTFNNGVYKDISPK